MLNRTDKRGAIAFRRGSGRTGRRTLWFLGVTVAVLAALPLLPVAAPPPPLPPQEAFEDWVRYNRWQVVSAKFSEGNGETVTIRLLHPDGNIVAVLHYRLLSSSVFEAPVERSR